MSGSPVEGPGYLDPLIALAREQQRDEERERLRKRVRRDTFLAYAAAIVSGVIWGLTIDALLRGGP